MTANVVNLTPTITNAETAAAYALLDRLRPSGPVAVDIYLEDVGDGQMMATVALTAADGGAQAIGHKMLDGTAHLYVADTVTPGQLRAVPQWTGRWGGLEHALRSL